MAWLGKGMLARLIDPRHRWCHVAIITVALAVHLSLHYATYLPALRGPLDNLPYFRLHMLHEAEFLLIIAYAGVVLGLRAGIVTLVITAATSVPFILTPYTFDRAPRTNEIRDLALQVGFILLMGLLIVLLYDRDKSRRLAESTASALREVAQLRNNFVAIASHELCTPLTALYGFSELLVTRQPDPEQQAIWIKNVHHETGRLANLVDELLNVSQIEAGTVAVRADMVEVGDLLDGVLNAVGNPPAGHHIIRVVPDGLPLVCADRKKVEQVLINLVSNAIKYSPQGGRVRVSAHPEPGSGQVTFKVADQGMGLSGEDQAKLFSTFYRVQRPETSGIEGTGLGLYISKSLVELMGGRIWLESRMDKGSTFAFTLPLWSVGTAGGPSSVASEAIAPSSNAA